MANNFSKEERVMFEDLLEGFNDQLILSSAVSKFNIGDVTAERANDTVWRPMPYILNSFDGIDQTGNFNDKTQLSVPSNIGFRKSVPFMMNPTQLRDGLQDNRLIEAAKQRLASDINVALMDTAAQQGTVVVSRSTAASGYDDIAEADASFNELGVGMQDRYMLLSSRTYNGMASNLAGRQTMGPKVTKAYERSYVGMVAGFETLKMDYANRLVAAAGTGVTINGANQRYVPAATSTAVGGQINVDNRYQNINITVTSGTVKVGDAFTIAGVNAVHHITKRDTGQLKTFRITRIVSGAGGTGTVEISPPIISADSSPTEAEIQYKNVTAAPANSAAVTFLNTQTADVNPFWHKDAIELIPARYIMPQNVGIESISATTDQGIPVLFTRQADINNLNVKYRLDVFFGTVLTQPEMAGIELFGQT